MPQTIADFTKHVRDLEARACPTPEDAAFFHRHIKQAPGGTYHEALEHVIRQRTRVGLNA